MAFVNRPFTETDVRRMLFQAEGCASPHGRGAPGHAGSSHVTITRQGMQDKAGRSGSTTPVASAFLRFDDQVQATLQILNNHVGQGAVDFLLQARNGRRVVMEGRIHGIEKTRWAAGERNWTQEPYGGCIVMDRSRVGSSSLHVQTCFPISHFSKGCPTWWPDQSGNVFQFPSGDPQNP